MRRQKEADQTCANCGRVYEVHSIKYPERDKGEAHCKCGELLLRWRNSTEYFFRLKTDKGASK